MNEPERCPFCGGMAMVATMQSDNMKMVCCVECLAHGRLCYTEEEAIAAWNRRTE